MGFLLFSKQKLEWVGIFVGHEQSVGERLFATGECVGPLVNDWFNFYSYNEFLHVALETNL